MPVPSAQSLSPQSHVILNRQAYTNSCIREEFLIQGSQGEFPLLQDVFSPTTSMIATAFPHQPQKDGNKSCSGQMLVTYATRRWVTTKEREGWSLLKLLLISSEKHKVSMELKRNKISKWQWGMAILLNSASKTINSRDKQLCNKV